MKELSTDLLDEIAGRLVNSLNPVMIYLFGSHASGTAGSGSDVDLLEVVPDTDISQRELARRG